jgi:hypothetical protein
MFLECAVNTKLPPVLKEERGTVSSTKPEIVLCPARLKDSTGHFFELKK